MKIGFRRTELPRLYVALENDEKEVGKNVAPALVLAGKEPSGTQGCNRTSLFLIVLLCSQVLLLGVRWDLWLSIGKPHSRSFRLGAMAQGSDDKIGLCYLDIGLCIIHSLLCDTVVGMPFYVG